MANKISEGVEIDVETFYQPDYSNPVAGEHMFAYRITIWNHNNFPVKLHRAKGEAAGAVKPFRFFGPTCDSLDAMPGPFWLPEDVREGDYVEIGMLGAYGVAMASRFNGFGQVDTLEVEDPPMLSMFGLAPRTLATPKVETADVVKLSRARGKRRRRR